MIQRTKQDYIDYRILKSNEILEDAVLLADKQRWNSCVNRLYYSCFYIVGALLYQYDIKAETHNGTKSQLHLYFIKTGKLAIEYGKLYSNLFDWRQMSDYADFTDFEEETIIPLVEQVSLFNRIILELIRRKELM